MAYQHHHETYENAPMLTLFVAKENKDLTEGRGGMIDVGYFTNHHDAYQKIKGRAVQGQGDGDVVKRTYEKCIECEEIVRYDREIYTGDNYTKNNSLGKPGTTYAYFLPDGWHIDYSPMAQDPEYKEYVRLRNKFEKRS